MPERRSTALKLVKVAKSVSVLDQLPAKTRPVAIFSYHLYHDKFNRDAPVGYRSFDEVRNTFKRAELVIQIVEMLPDIAKAVSKNDYSQLALDLDNILGLRPCVQLVAS